MSRNLLIYGSGWEEKIGKAVVRIEIKDEENQKILKYIKEDIETKDRLEAEYEAFIHGLFNAYTLQGERVRFISNNKDFVNQLLKSRKNRNKLLLPLQEQARKLTRGFKEVKIEFLEPLEEMAVAS
ncbi:MAG: reverse transcriptase-like protein [Nitrospirae bacterium]|nr:reverse transcriptase-like protein [Nitrospirota bacterium]